MNVKAVYTEGSIQIKANNIFTVGIKVEFFRRF